MLLGYQLAIFIGQELFFSEDLNIELQSSNANKSTVEFSVFSVVSGIIFMILVAYIEYFEVIKDLVCAICLCVGDCSLPGLLVS